MTTTAHEDQFTIGTQTIEPVRQPYNTVSILRRNIADMEVALRTQTELKEKAEAELANLAQQKPVAWRHENGNIFLPWQKDLITTSAVFSPLYAAPVHAPAVPAVPDGWMEWGGGSVPPVLKDDQHNYEFLRRDGQLAAFVTNWQHGIEGIGTRDIVAYRRKACVLQSAEVRHD
jgi:hypothetical protein